MFAGFIIINKTNSPKRCELAITDAGTPVPYSITTEVDSHSRKRLQAGADAPNDYLIGARVNENEAVVNTRDIVSPDANVAVAVVTIEESRISIAGRGYEEVPDDFFESATATQ